MTRQLIDRYEVDLQTFLLQSRTEAEVQEEEGQKVIGKFEGQTAQEGINHTIIVNTPLI